MTTILPKGHLTDVEGRRQYGWCVCDGECKGMAPLEGWAQEPGASGAQAGAKQRALTQRHAKATQPQPLPIADASHVGTSPMATQVDSDRASDANDAATDLLQIANGVAKAKPAKTNYRDRTREKANELVSSKKWLKRKAANQFVVEGEEDRILGGTSQDVEVLRSYTKAAKKMMRMSPIKLGSRTGQLDVQAKHLAQQLESFFREHNGGSDSFTPK